MPVEIRGKKVAEPVGEHRVVAGRDWGARVFVWGAWGVLFLALLYLVASYGRSVPFSDDWVFLQGLVGVPFPSFETLWHQNNEHRHPLPLLIMWLSLKVTDYDFRGPVFFCALALGGLAFGMIRAAGRLRGRTRYVDAFFPLVLFSTAWSDSTFFFGNALFFVLPTVVAGTLLVIAAEKGTQLTLRSLLLAGTCLVLLPLISASGLLYLPAFFVWLWLSTLAGLGRVRSRLPAAGFPSKSGGSPANSAAKTSPGGGSRTPPGLRPRGHRYGLLTAMTAVSALLFLILFVYFQGYVWGSHMDVRPTLQGLIRSVSAFLGATGLPGYDRFFGHDSYVIWTLFLSSLAALLITICTGKGPQRSRALGLLFFLGAYGSLTLGISWGREGSTGAYALLAVPFLCWCYLVWACCYPHTVGYLVQTCLLIWALLPLQSATQADLSYLASRNQGLDAFVADVKEGLPPYLLVARHKEAMYPCLGDHGLLAQSLSLLRQAGVGVFRHMGEDPAFVEVPVPLDQVTGSQMTWANGTGRGEGPGCYLTIPLKEPTFVAGIRLVSDTPAYLSHISWKKGGDADFPETPQFASLVFGNWTTVFIGDTVDAIRILPMGEGPFEMRITEIALLVPAKDG